MPFWRHSRIMKSRTGSTSFQRPSRSKRRFSVTFSGGSCGCAWLSVRGAACESGCGACSAAVRFLAMTASLAGSGPRIERQPQRGAKPVRSRQAQAVRASHESGQLRLAHACVKRHSVLRFPSRANSLTQNICPISVCVFTGFHHYLPNSCAVGIDSNPDTPILFNTTATSSYVNRSPAFPGQAD